MGAQGWLRTVMLAAGMALALPGCRDPSEHPVAPPLAGKLVLNGVTVVDTRDGGLVPGMSLLAEGGKIVRIAPTGSLAADASAESIDATGKFVVPGYLDMHAHPLGPGDPSGDLALMLAHGITGFRQMAGSAELLSRRRAGRLPISPDAPALLATPGPVLTPFNARNPEAAAATVRAQQAAGADFVKLALATPEVFFAVLEEAERIGIPAVGHVPADVDVVAASRAGMRSIEHLGPANGILVACSTEEVALRQGAPRIPGALRGPPFEIPFADALVAFLIRDRIINPAAGAGVGELGRMRRVVETYSNEKCRRVAAELVANDTWQVPTLIRIRSSQLAFEPGLQGDPSLRYVPRATLERWRKVTRKFEEELSPEDEATLRDVYALDLALVKRLDSAGVKMMAGSDVVGAGWLVPGVSLHQELDELEKAGLSPLRVLQMATLRGAEFLGRTSSLGSVEPGKDADLVLLDANPLESVQNLHAIHAVVRAGSYRSRDDLEALKRKVEAGAAAH